MLDIVSRRNNFFDKGDVEMGFVVKCSPTLEVFMHITYDFNMLAISSPANIRVVFFFFPCI